MTTLTSVERDLLVAAMNDRLTFRSGQFMIDAIELPAIEALTAREMVSAGLLAKDGPLVRHTPTGRHLLAT